MTTQTPSSAQLAAAAETDSLAAAREAAHEESLAVELRRTMVSGTVWFAAAIIAIGLPLSGLYSAGWRPSDLPMPAETAWWLGAAITLIGTAGFAWAGCPILAWDAGTAQRQKALSIRAGVLLYFIGTVTAAVAVLAVPA